MATIYRIATLALVSFLSACGGGDPECGPGLEWKELTAYGQTYWACASVEAR